MHTIQLAKWQVQFWFSSIQPHLYVSKYNNTKKMGVSVGEEQTPNRSDTL